MRLLTWNAFDNCISFITSSCKQKKFTGVYGFPRGGLCLAVAISHSLNIPLLNNPKPNCLILDDIYETGKTLESINNLNNITAFVWISKCDPIWWQAVEVYDSSEWIIFPWENKSLAVENEKAYRRARNL